MNTRARVPGALLVPAFAAALISLVPLWYLFDTATSRGLGAVIDELWRQRTLLLIWRSLALTVAVTVSAVVIGTFCAWTVVMSGMRLRLPMLVLFSLSLAIPSYLAAFAWVSWIPGINGFVGVFIVLTFVCYPYVMLPVAAAMRGVDPLHEDVARSLGRRSSAVFFSLTLGQVRSAMTGGALLVALYVLSDFGAVAAMRYEAFTWVIYGAYRAGFNPSRAAILSIVLVMLALALTVAEVSIRGRHAPNRLGGGTARSRRRPSGGASPLVAGFVSVVVIGFGVGVPVISVVTWLRRDSETTVRWSEVGTSILTSFQIGILTSVVAVLLALPVAIFAVRYKSPLSRSLERATYVSHALPGIVVGISVVFLGIRTLRPIYQHLSLLVLGQAILFLPLAVASVRSAVEQSTVGVEEVARSLGSTPVMTILRVTLPLALPGILAAGAMTMLSAVKELPTTLLLRPTGTETLATSIWKYSSVSDYAAVAPFALALIVLAAAPVAVLTALSATASRAS